MQKFVPPFNNQRTENISLLIKGSLTDFYTTDVLTLTLFDYFCENTKHISLSPGVFTLGLFHRSKWSQVDDSAFPLKSPPPPPLCSTFCGPLDFCIVKTKWFQPSSCFVLRIKNLWIVVCTYSFQSPNSEINTDKNYAVELK